MANSRFTIILFACSSLFIADAISFNQPKHGLVGGAFKETQNYIQELGIVVDIDPTKFEEFEVIQVPAFLLSKEGKYDRMVGNISLVGFLEQSSISGDLKKEASDLYKKLQGEQP